jgi:hypothetical protein
MIKRIITPWDESFYEMVATCESKLRITSPFVKERIVNRLFENKRINVGFELVTSCKLMNFYRKASDINALTSILEKGGKIYNHQNMHSKIYIFDDKKAIITSSNLTYGGLTKNFEYGLEVSDPNVVKQVITDFNNLISDEKTGSVELSETLKISDIIDSLPKEERVILPKIKENEDEQDTEVFTGDIKIVESNLTGWLKDVFVCVNEIRNERFSLNDIYAFEDRLSKLHPDNSFIKDKIRQQLQKLRDIGLIQFLGAGNYKKLWL